MDKKQKVTSNTNAQPLWENELIDDVLRSLHVSGSVLLKEVYRPPWSISIPDEPQLRLLLEVEKNVKVVTFHLVESGHCTIKTKYRDKIHLNTGEMVVCFGGEPHLLASGTPTKIQKIEDLLSGGPNTQSPDGVNNSHSVALLCGVFLLKNITFNPLYESLPNILHTKLVQTDKSNNLTGVAHVIAEELKQKLNSGNYIVERLLEVLCAVAIRTHIASEPSNRANWLRAVKDPVIGQAIAAIHSNPSDDWSVKKMAGIVAMSPSRFAARFTQTTGDSPMSYTTKWRINLACSALINTKQNVEQIARQMGYASPTAFSRIFKKHIGTSPTYWRIQQQI